MNPTKSTGPGYKRRRDDSPHPLKKKSLPHNGEKNSDSSGGKKEKNPSCSTASKTCLTATQKQNHKNKYNPYHIYSRYNAKHNTGKSFCGYYWHSTRLARKGTETIFGKMKQDFQSKATDGKIGWEGVKEMLFNFKKEQDQAYRNMMWHFLNTECDKCIFWDDVYRKQTANVSPDDDFQEISDEECIKAAMEVDGTCE